MPFFFHFLFLPFVSPSILCCVSFFYFFKYNSSTVFSLPNYFFLFLLNLFVCSFSHICILCLFALTVFYTFFILFWVLHICLFVVILFFYLFVYIFCICMWNFLFVSNYLVCLFSSVASQSFSRIFHKICISAFYNCCFIVFSDFISFLLFVTLAYFICVRFAVPVLLCFSSS